MIYKYFPGINFHFTLWFGQKIEEKKHVTILKAVEHFQTKQPVSHTAPPQPSRSWQSVSGRTNRICFSSLFSLVFTQIFCLILFQNLDAIVKKLNPHPCSAAHQVCPAWEPLNLKLHCSTNDSLKTIQLNNVIQFCYHLFDSYFYFINCNLICSLYFQNKLHLWTVHRFFWRRDFF